MAATSGDFVITRIFNAPPALVFQAWTDAKRLTQWWGAQGAHHGRAQTGPAPRRHIPLQHAYTGGHEMWGRFVYREVVAPERLVFVSAFSDAAGGITRHPLSATWPLEMLSTVTFSEQGGTGQAGRTLVTLRGSPLDATDEERKTFEAGHGSMQQGFTGTMDELAAYLAQLGHGRPVGRRKLTFERVLDAPPATVFKAWTDPRQMAKWRGLHGFTAPACELDARPGGELRIVMRVPDGAEFPMIGRFREVVAPERLVFTAIAVDAAGNHLLDGLPIVTFAEEGGKTRMKVQTSAAAVTEIGQGYLAGMEQGWSGSLEKLKVLVGSG